MITIKSGRLIAVSTALAAGVLLIAPPAVPRAAPSGPPAAGKPPSASTQGASQITGSSVTLAGAVDPRGVETSFYFQYGASVAYGGQTPTASAGAGGAPVEVSQPISGLLPGTTYHYRLVAITAAGAAVIGQDRSFTTRKVPLKLRVARPLAPVIYGGRLTIEGALEGTGAAGRPVVLQGSPFPYIAPFADLSGPVASNSGGGFSFSLAGLTQSTQLRVATLDTPPVTGQAITVRVAVRVTLRARPSGRGGYVRFSGTVTPAVLGAPVTFQLVRPGLGPISAGGGVVVHHNARSGRFSSVVFIRHGRGGRYRALVRVSSGGLVSGESPTVAVRAAPAPAPRGPRAHARRPPRR